MSKLGRGVLLVLWIAYLVVAAQWRTRAAQAQEVQKGLVLSGADLGFRLDKVASGKATGTLVVKLNGQWVDVGGGYAQAIPAVAR
jgi:hypothetical protein